ncbi:MAG: glycosyltransferase, partial [Terriglobia bacterium]
SDPNSPQAAANGQYILVRRSAYERTGGHQAGRKTILEDVDLARRVKQSGGRLLFLPGGSWVQARMYQRFGEMWAGWSKNLYLLFRRDLASLLKAAFRMAVLNILLPLLLFALPFFLRASHAPLDFAVCWILACALLAGQYGFYRSGLRRLGYDPSLAKYIILGSALFASLLLNSARIYRTGGQVHWKGRVYAAKESL